MTGDIQNCYDDIQSIFGVVIILPEKSWRCRMNEEQYKIEMLAVDELIPWETNQSIVLLTDVPLDIVRKRRNELRKHNRHDVDDTELGTQEWV